MNRARRYHKSREHASRGNPGIWNGLCHAQEQQRDWRNAGDHHFRIRRKILTPCPGWLFISFFSPLVLLSILLTVDWLQREVGSKPALLSLDRVAGIHGGRHPEVRPAQRVARQSPRILTL